jgi:hypothetical protein
MRASRLWTPGQDPLPIVLPAGPPETVVSTDGDGGSLLVAFLAICLAGIVLSAYYLGWWLEHEPQPAGILVVAGPAILLAVAVAEAIQRDQTDLVMRLSVLLCGLLTTGVILLFAPGSASAPLGLLVVVGAIGALVTNSSHESAQRLVRQTPLIAASAELIAAGTYHLTSDSTARVVAGASGLAVVAVAAVGACSLLLANGRRERRRARFDRELDAWLADVQVEG